MAEWKKAFLNLGSRAENEFDRLKARLEARLDRDKPIQIIIYRGFGTLAGTIYVSGRVLRDKPIAPARLFADEKEVSGQQQPHYWKKPGHVGNALEPSDAQDGQIRCPSHGAFRKAPPPRRGCRWPCGSSR